MFYSSASARVECFCGSKVMSSLTSPTSQTKSVKVNSKFVSQNNSCFDLSLTAPTLGARNLMGVKKKCFPYTEGYSRRDRRISILELIIDPLTCNNL